MPSGVPHALRCEYQIDPLGLGTRRPRFFWKLDDERPDAYQSAYRVLVASDPDRLAQVLVNLLDNALKHTPAGGKVAVVGYGLRIEEGRAEPPISDLYPPSLPPLPNLSWPKKTGPRDSSLMATAISAKTGLRKSRAAPDNAMSRIRLIDS